MLAMNDYYDAVGFHYNHSYKAVEETINHIRNIMAQSGSIKPIWAGDTLIAHAHAVDTRFAVNHKTPRFGSALFDAIDNPASPYHNRAWQLADQASSLIKKVVFAQAVGMAGIMSPR